LASKRNPVVPPKEKERIQSFLSDFISTHWEQMISFLRNIELSSFTKNALSEASLILSLLSEFCKKPCSDRRAYHAIYSEFLPIATSLIGRIGVSSVLCFVLLCTRTVCTVV
jgi:hypothetical protein